MKKKIFTVAGLALLVAVASSCSVQLRGYNRPWMGKVYNQQVSSVKNS